MDEFQTQVTVRLTRIEDGVEACRSRLDKINGHVENHERRIDTTERSFEKHRVYHSVMEKVVVVVGGIFGAVLLAIITVLIGRWLG